MGIDGGGEIEFRRPHMLCRWRYRSRVALDTSEGHNMQNKEYGYVQAFPLLLLDHKVGVSEQTFTELRLLPLSAL